METSNWSALVPYFRTIKEIKKHDAEGFVSSFIHYFRYQINPHNEKHTYTRRDFWVPQPPIVNTADGIYLALKNALEKEKIHNDQGICVETRINPICDLPIDWELFENQILGVCFETAVSEADIRTTIVRFFNELRQQPSQQ